MKRLIYAGATILAAMTWHLQPAQARLLREGPWCAVINFGGGDVVWDCEFNSVEECRPNVIAGTRGFCNPNPRWPGWSAPAETGPKKHVRHHKRRVKRD